MAIRINNAMAAAALSATGVAEGLGSGTLTLYDAVQPTNAADIHGGTALAVITLPATAFTVTDNVASLSGSWSETVGTSGETLSGRFVSSTGDRRLDFSVSTVAAGTGDVQGDTDDVNLIEGGTVNITGFDLTMPLA